ncbi:tetratricopeptide repeat protein [Massilia niabensis]|uniref:Tetratricopeptide repeat protein n=1 Tax=Massilia niabensis TaxID=544910 RepID=A0ABW0L4I0_9BURK
MSVLKSITALSLVMLAPAGSVLAQAAPEPAPQSVTVTGKRVTNSDPRMVTAAKSAVLSRNLASGCNYMSAYSAAEDDVTQAYMRDMGMEHSLSNEVERFDERSPDGDASTSSIASSIPKEEDPSVERAAGGCGPSDRRFAAGRNRILRKDKSLAKALDAFAAQDYATAREQASIAWTKIGYDEAALMLARMHLSGLGVPLNTPQAVSWLEKAALARFDPIRDRVEFNPQDPEAMTARVEATLLLAKIYLRGIGTAKDPAQASKWYAKAAEIGFVPATNTLGMAAMNGFGMPKSARKAAAWFKEAAEAGYAPAQYNLARLHYMGEDEVPQDLKLAGAWFAAAAKSGHAGALFAAGRMYDLGEGVPVDQQKAIVYYKEAALRSNADAQSALATYFYTGEVVQKDLATARKLFAAAARQGQPDAMFNLGVMTAQGEAGVKDMATAYAWITLAKGAGHEGAAKALAQLGPMLTAADRVRVDAVLKPKSAP